jgi:hypothetical protein
VQLESAALAEEVAAGANWQAVQERVEALLKQQQTEPYDVMKRFLESAKTDPWSKARILEVYLHHDVTRAKELAPKYLDAKDDALRLLKGTARLEEGRLVIRFEDPQGGKGVYEWHLKGTAGKGKFISTPAGGERKVFDNSSVRFVGK